MTSKPPAPELRIATRGSPLALAQAEKVVEAIQNTTHYKSEQFEIKVKTYRTSGDRMQSGALSRIGGKGLFTKEIEEALLDNEADIAVHSMKDVPTIMPNGLIIAAFLPRSDFRDALVSRYQSINDLPQGAILGTASLRRQAIIKNIRPDIVVKTLRGNVQTRLARITAGDFDATLLAAAGLERLGLMESASAILSPDVVLPAVCQGTIGIECRENDEKTRELLEKIDDPVTRMVSVTERSFLRELDGSCRMPIAALATKSKDSIKLRGLIVRPDGAELIGDEAQSATSELETLGIELARRLIEKAEPGFFDGD
jgi:hydroxymethylbilane synthase